MIRSIVRTAVRAVGSSLPAVLAVLLSATEASARPGALGIASVLELQDAAALRRLAAQAGLPTMTMAQARDRFQRSGMSVDELRRRLEDEGLDAGLADSFLPASVGGDVGNEQITLEMMQALVRVGLLVGDEEVETLGAPEPPEPGTVPAEEPEAVPTGIRDLGADLEVFGSQVFRGARRSAVLAAPPGEEYVLGPGDRLFLYITGDVEQAHALEVTREGTAFIPRAGSMVVTGLTLAEFETRLGGRLRNIYSGIGRGPESRTRYSVSLGRVRTIRVHVVGAVHAPGSYVVSSVASLVDAMYDAGGPTLQGSFRNVRLMRGNEEIEVDLYPFLTNGRLDVNPRLREGDVVHVPWAHRQVAVRGMVRKPAIYEIREGEGLAALVDFAGGLLPTARTDLASVDRVLPPDERSPARDRVHLDAPLSSVLAGKEVFPVEAGDRILIWRVHDDVRRRVLVQGAVVAPGNYSWEPGLTVGSLIEMAGGLRPEALTSDVLVVRRDRSAGEVLRRMVVDLTMDRTLSLEEDDQVTIFSRAALREVDSVSIQGAVALPGRYLFVDGMTPGDLVLEAGGFLASAMPWRVEIARRLKSGSASYGAQSISSRIRASVVETSRAAQFSDLPVGGEDSATGAMEVELEPDDIVYVRQRAGFGPLATVTLEGQFVQAGDYVLNSAEERLSVVVARAGGLTSPLVTDIQLHRGDVIVAVNVGGTRRGALDDPILQDGDRVVAVPFRNTIRVVGEVEFPTEVTFRAGLSVSDVLSEAGGVRSAGDRGALSVTYRDGSRETTRKILGLFRSDPVLFPGADVFVPTRVDLDDDSFDWAAFSSIMLALASTIATMILAINSGGGGG